ncbi:hypothetical protein Tco_1192135 [Tanacetum coccineum]
MLRDRNVKESWALLEDLALYDNESQNDPRDFAKPVKVISLPQDILNKYMESLELGKNGLAFIQGEMPKRMEDPGLFTLPCRLGDSKPFDTLDGTKSYPVGIVKDVEVHIGRLKLLNGFYIILLELLEM